MKMFFCLFLAAFVAWPRISQAQLPARSEASPDIGLIVLFDMPGIGDYDLYQYGLGSEIQFRDWVSHPWGYSITLGYSEWATDKNATSPGSELYDFEGKLEIVPFGGSVIYNAYAGEEWNIALDAGVRWLAIDSKITALNYGQDPDDRFKVDVDDAVLLTLAVNADYNLSADVMWSVGLGYRTDISRGEVSTELGPARDSIMESFLIQTGLRVKL